MKRLKSFPVVVGINLNLLPNSVNVILILTEVSNCLNKLKLDCQNWI